MRVYSIVAAALLASAATSPACAQTSAAHAQSPVPKDLAARAEAYMKAAVQYEQFSGNVLISRDGAPILTLSYGMADYERHVPNTPQTVFRIASLTKAFTSMAVMQLQERGKLKVGDPICNYLTNCPAAWAPVTIHQLLTHSSGIPNFSNLPDWDGKLEYQDYRPGEIVQLFRTLPLQFAPGSAFKYSNSGYYLLGLIIERVSGMSYGDYLQANIFAPLGMTRSALHNSRALLPDRALGYDSLGTSFVNAPYQSATTAFSNGGLYSTVGDLLRWERALSSEKLVSKRSLETIFTADKGGYGYGWQVGERFGRKRADHSGAFKGYSTYLVHFPDERLSVIVLSNSDRAQAAKVGVALSAIALGEKYTMPVAQLRDVLWDAIARKGVEPAIQRYRELKRTQPDAYDFGDDTLVDLGYDLFNARKLDAAKAMFELNLQSYPESAGSHDGLGDIADARGDMAGAIAHFEASLRFDKDNRYATEALARIRRNAGA